MAGELILVVDDEANILDLARLYLEREGYRVDEAMDGQQALDKIESLEPALVILDIMLPEVDGFDVCRRVRAESDVPIIMLTARDDDVDKIVGLELGADDYMTKPFNPRELVARVKAILRRAESAPRRDDSPIHIGDLTIDPARHFVSWRSEDIELTVTEFMLLKALAQRPGHVKSRDQLMDAAYGEHIYVDDRTIDSHIKRLRKKFRVVDPEFSQIETLYGVGYRYKENP